MYAQFDGIWDVLVRYNLVDDIGSVEYCRVLALWVSAGRPTTCAEFVFAEVHLQEPIPFQELGGEG